MIEVRQTETFRVWLSGLGDDKARARIIVRIVRLGLGNPGDVKSGGGTKKTQSKDIVAAQAAVKILKG